MNKRLSSERDTLFNLLHKFQFRNTKSYKIVAKSAKILTRMPKPDNDNVQADDEIIQSQATFQYTHLIVHRKSGRKFRPIRQGKVSTVHLDWLFNVLTNCQITEPFDTP